MMVFGDLEFSKILDRDFRSMFDVSTRVAVAVSGGPDSMALLKLLSVCGRFSAIDALIVDHGLRAESAVEARGVADAARRWPGVTAHILRWDGGGDLDTRVQEEARKARYALMHEHCQVAGIRYLFLGHHRDDQAETFLFRLAKGSGLDGLCGMNAVQDYAADLDLVRPLLGVSKEELVAYCTASDVPYVEDPSNESERFARVRLRRSFDALAEEGLTAKRLAVTAGRLARARRALEVLAERAFDDILLEKEPGRVVLNGSGFSELVDEVGLRVVLMVIKMLNPADDYLPRMEKIEDLFADLSAEDSFRKRTLGGLIFERDDGAGQIIICRE